MPPSQTHPTTMLSSETHPAIMPSSETNPAPMSPSEYHRREGHYLRNLSIMWIGILITKILVFQLPSITALIIALAVAMVDLAVALVQFFATHSAFFDDHVIYNSCSSFCVALICLIPRSDNWPYDRDDDTCRVVLGIMSMIFWICWFVVSVLSFIYHDGMEWE
ncbi:hypothetical protein DEU56DRAFT_815143 [Suillus clintonianus]|uniref:uncharacterized protein n=1 Tax=Suillus clintonianus TaxID=1904413 RepID=UPI001B86B512|nr:uncharacterized protein DEU56DRAFT_815143 [Suillus clintonianus]KAG2130689.1 hypothetical protein DEU56DRAFT_815143 [Suillus clintonianus]